MKNAVAILCLVLIAVPLYALTLRGVLGNPTIETVKSTYEGATNPLELSPERGRFAHVMALAETGNYELGDTLGMLAYPDVGYINGRLYSYFAPGISYMVTPLYLLGKQFGLAQVFTFAFMPVMSILAMIYLFKIAREIINLPVWASLLAPIIFAFGSTAWSYSVTLYQHHLTTFFIVSGFYAVWRYAKRTRYSWAWGVFVWFNYALALAIDYPNAVLMFPVIAYFFLASWSIRLDGDRIRFIFRNGIIFTSIIFILITGVHFYHNKIHFGGWLSLSGELSSYKNIVEGETTPEKVNSAGSGKSAVGFFKEERIVRGFEKLTVSTDRGLFFYGPIFLLGFWGLIQYVWKNRSLEAGILVALVITNLFLYSSWGDPWGGWAYGTRYLIISMGILSIFIAWWAVQYRTWYWRLLLVILFAYSSGIGLLGAITTNAVPPDVEAIGLGIPDNYMLNIRFLEDGKSGSFLYRTYIHSHMTLSEYFWSILLFVVGVFLMILFGFRKIYEES